MAATQLQGLNIMVYVDKTPLGGQKNCTLSMEADTIDVSNKNDFGWASFISGAKSWTVSCDGQFLVTEEKGEGDETVITQESSQSALMNAFLGNKVVEVEMKNEDGSIAYEGQAVITSLELEAAFDDVFAYSVELQGKGALTIPEKQKQN